MPALELFQSTHPTRECDCFTDRLTIGFLYFNPRTLQESATAITTWLRPCNFDFNPRTLQESATSGHLGKFPSGSISIHAPYKRVRHVPIVLDNYTMYLFQSTHPTRECDASADSKIGAALDFNPRTLQESATPRQFLHYLGHEYFNPRTLQESATAICCSILSGIMNFNPRTLQESATQLANVRANAKIFQSTHPTRECDTALKSSTIAPLYFNPRTLQESATQLLAPCQIY